MTASEASDGGEKAPEKAPSYASAVDGALADMRGAAKWLVGAFAATGAVVFAGLQLTSLKDLNTEAEGWRLCLAMAGFGIAIIGIIIAISSIGRFLRRTPILFADLLRDTSEDYVQARKVINGDPTILGIYKDLETLNAAYLAKIRTIESAEISADAKKRATGHAQSLLRIMSQALSRASFVISSRRYSTMLSWAAAGAVIAAFGGGAFAVALAQPKEAREASLPTVVRPPTTVEVTFLDTTSRQDEFKREFGDKCNLKKVAAVVLEQQAISTFKIAAIATESCKSAVLTIDQTDAVVVVPAAAAK